ncbi:hypothetical protein AVEN_21559-1 [Araneus ventricosus]|uniref:Histone-lysine N-methyltransferase SETMAR n=1 Tax=Araneus ventricosus TaxID=182803 RepID=A0A4Y2MNY2_ARAVE|nr:hypothetical protein AVEN_21559-1 [Araneus ventricosus]
MSLSREFGNRREDEANGMAKESFVVSAVAAAATDFCVSLIHHEFVPAGTTANAESSERVLKRLLQRIRRVRPQLYQSGQWKLLHDNACPHTAIRVRHFLARRKVTVLEHPLYSPDLAPADFLLFPHPRGVLKGLRFSDIAQIHQRVTTVLRAILKEEFADSFQQRYNRCQKCIVANGDYFECQGQFRSGYDLCHWSVVPDVRPDMVEKRADENIVEDAVLHVLATSAVAVLEVESLEVVRTEAMVCADL